MKWLKNQRASMYVYKYPVKGFGSEFKYALLNLDTEQLQKYLLIYLKHVKSPFVIPYFKNSVL